MNADGSVIVGWRDQLTGGRTAAKWVNGVPELITNEDGSLNGEAHAVSADGRTIVGEGYKLRDKAWIWRDGEGVTPIGSANGFRNVDLTALDVSDNGKIAVGFASKGAHSKAFIWRKGGDASYLNSWLITEPWCPLAGRSASRRSSPPTAIRSTVGALTRTA